MAPATETTDSVVVEALGLTKIFRDFWGRPKARAVNGVDFEIRKGQIFGLLGPNGSGKSTTVKMILGLLYPTRGTLRVFGQSPSRVDIKHRIGYLPEESYLYKYLTAGETLDFFGALFGLTPEERRNRSTQLLEMVGLANSYHRPVGEFSKGMARRIGLAQALVNDPDLVILDEPTSGLDPIGCREVKDVIQLLASRGKTVLLCSHLLADVEDVCDQVVVLYGGKVRTSGTLKDILTVEDRTRIVTPRLEGQALEHVRKAIAEHVDAASVAVDQPSMNLEDFFLEVVSKARAASVETAGAQSGGEIAPYLRGPDGDGPTPENVLAALQRDTEATPVAEPEEEDAGDSDTAAETEAREQRLAALAAPGEEPPATTEPEERPEAPQEKDADAGLTQASRKLQDLLGDQDGTPGKSTKDNE